MKKILFLLLIGPLAFSLPAKKKKTVGELLKQADRGAGIQLQEKKKVSLPTFSGESAPATKKSVVDLNRVKPPKTSSFYENSTDDNSRLERITDEQIRELYKLTQQFKGSSQRGELWLRLAELYVEKSGVIEFRKQAEYDKKLRDFQSGQTQVKPALNLSDARQYNRRAIQLYEWFVRDFPKDSKMDQALFFLGYNSYEIGDLKKGTSYYIRLTKEHPSSPFVTEAHFALAEYYFENEKWKNAKEDYAFVLKRPRHRLYTFSMYKTAWCYYRTGQSGNALKTMESLVRSGKQQAAEADAGRKAINKGRLESEGLRDMVLFYADVGEPAKAPAYFQSLAGNDGINYVEKLAYFYGDKGNIDASRTLFRYLIAQNNTAAKAFDYKYQIVQLFSNGKKSKEFREELYSWVRDFGVGGAWYQANKNSKELIDNSYKLRETTLRNYTLQQHQTAQNSRAPYSQGLALEGYRLYITEFTTSPVIADMHFYFGELLYDMGKFDEASAQYRWVVENGPNSKFASKSAENIVHALEREIPKDSEISARVGKALEPVAFDARVERFISVSNWYISKFPTADKAPEIKFRIGRLYYQHNQFDQAIPYFREIVQKYPKTKYAEYSANLLLDIFNLKKDYIGLEKTGTEMLAVPGIANSKAGQDIRGVLEKANFKKAQDLETSKDFSGSALQFESFAKQNPTSPLVPTSLFNAAINYERAGQNSAAIAAHVNVINSKDKEAVSFKPKSRRILGKLYQDAGMLDEAASIYRTSAAELGNDPLVPNLHFNSAILSEALGHNEDALREYQASYDKSKKSDRIENVFQMANLYRRQGSSSKAIERYKFYLESGGQQPEKLVESAYWVHHLSQELRRRKDAEEYSQKTLALQRRYSPNKKGIGASYAAKIQFEGILKSFEEMRAIRIPADPKRQQAAAQQKIGMMAKLNQEIAELIKYDSPEEIVGSLSILGQANQHMGDALVNAPLPAGLSADETKQYKAGVEKLAAPFFSKAKESLKAAIDRGSELDVYPIHYFKAREVLASLAPGQVYEGGEMSVESRQMSGVSP